MSEQDEDAFGAGAPESPPQPRDRGTRSPLRVVGYVVSVALWVLLAFPLVDVPGAFERNGAAGVLGAFTAAFGLTFGIAAAALASMPGFASDPSCHRGSFSSPPL